MGPFWSEKWPTVPHRAGSRSARPAATCVHDKHGDLSKETTGFHSSLPQKNLLGRRLLPVVRELESLRKRGRPAHAGIPRVRFVSQTPLWREEAKMSIGGDAGAMAAAGEIAAFVREKIFENRDKPEVVAVLEEIKKKAEEIAAAAEAGWY